MDRLTTRNSEGIAVLKTPYQCERCGEEIYRLAHYGNGEPIEKLARYEELQDRLNKKFNGCISIEELIDSFVEFYDQQEKDEELAEALLIVNDNVRKYQKWEILEEQGKLLKLPCKLGDTTYWISDEDNEGNKVLTVRENNPIIGIAVQEDGLYILADGDDDYQKIDTRWAFLTREEAETALKEMQEGEA